MKFGLKKLVSLGYPVVMILCSFVMTLSCERRTDGHHVVASTRDACYMYVAAVKITKTRKATGISSNPKVDRLMALLRVPLCANWHQHRFIRFQKNHVHKFGNRRTDGRTNGQVEDMMPGPASLAW